MGKFLLGFVVAIIVVLFIVARCVGAIVLSAACDEPRPSLRYLASMDLVRRILGRGPTSPHSVRASTGGQTTWDDPSSDQLLALLSAVARGDEEFLIVERSSDRSGQTYIQTSRGESDWVVEHRDGSAERHFRTRVPDLEAVHAILTAWARDGDDWRTTVAWERITL